MCGECVGSLRDVVYIACPWIFCRSGVGWIGTAFVLISVLGERPAASFFQCHSWRTYMNRSCRFALGISFILLMSGLPCSQTTASADEIPPRPLVQTRGEAKIPVVPDIAIVSFGVETTREDVADAERESSKRAAELARLFASSGVAEKDVQTSGISIYPVYGGGRRTQPNQYTVRQNLTVQIRDFDKLSHILREALDRGANSVSQFTFDSSRRDELEDQARILALRDAKKKASAMAAELGVTLGKPYFISDMQTVTPWGAGGQMLRATAASSESGPHIAPGEVEIRTSVQVAFEMH